MLWPYRDKWLTVENVKSAQGVVAVVEMYEGVVLDLLDSFDGTKASHRLVEDALQRLLRSRHHQVPHVQDLHL